MSELNPNHPVLQVVHDHWHKIAALLLAKNGQDHVVITLEDLQRIDGRGLFVTIQELSDGLHLRLVDEATALRLAREHGGRPT